MKLFGLGKYSEKQIADDIRNGSNAAVKKLYDESSGYLLALCSRYIPDHATAEDVLQDSFLKILFFNRFFHLEGQWFPEGMDEQNHGK